MINIFPLLFGISGGEILILLLLVLLLFGPKKIPEIARMLGRGMNEVKKVQREINTEIHRYSSEIETEAKEMESEINKLKKDPDREHAGEKSHKESAGNSSAENGKDETISGSADPVEDPGKDQKTDDGNHTDELPYPYGPKTEE